MSSDGMMPDRSPIPDPLEVLLAQKTCARCYHLVTKGLKSGNIYSTLAYTKCRCHRNWKYLVPAPLLPEHLQASRPTSARNRNAVAPPLMPLRGPHSVLKTTGGTGKPIQLQPLQSRPAIASGVKNKPAIASGVKNKPAIASGVKNKLAIASGVKNKLSELKAAKRSQQFAHKPQYPNGSNNLHLIAAGKLAAGKLPALSESSVVPQSGNSSLPGVGSSSSTPESKLVVSPVRSSLKLSSIKGQHGLSPVPSSLKLSPIHSNLRLSPKQSAIRLPQISDGSVIHPRARDPSQDICSNPSTQLLQSTTHKHDSTFELVQLVKYIPGTKRAVLSELFSAVDHNDDGHLTFHEFVSSLPAHWLACNPPLLSYYLRQLYHALSDSTYFGKREFVLSYCVAEAVHHAGPCIQNSLPYPGEVLQTCIPSLLHCLIQQLHGDSPSLSARKIQEAMEWHSSLRLQQVTLHLTRLGKVLEEGMIPLVTFFSLGPYLLHFS